MEATDDRLGCWMPLVLPGSVVTIHSCSECECVEHGSPLPGHCPSCNATMTVPAEADEDAIVRLIDGVRQSVSFVALMRISIRPPGKRLDPFTRRPA